MRCGGRRTSGRRSLGLSSRPTATRGTPKLSPTLLGSMVTSS
nr:MAG TPA: hypothetical protein [Caudoviricetes sp.]